MLIRDVLTIWLNKTAWQRSPHDHPGRIEVVEQVDKVIAEGVKLQKVGVSKRDGFPVSTKSNETDGPQRKMRVVG